MTRGRSGAIIRTDGSLWVGPVRVSDARVQNVRELLSDLARPGLCLILGAGASHGVVPLSPKDMAAVAWEVIRAEGNFSATPVRQRQQLVTNPELTRLVELLKEFPPDSWERFLDDVPDLLAIGKPIGVRSNSMGGFLTTAPDALSASQATVVWDGVFTPRTAIPPALVDIYSVFERQTGSIVCYNYDQIVERQKRFPIISPHGVRPAALTDPKSREAMRRLAWEAHKPIPTDWHLILAEDDQVRVRREYQKAVLEWRRAHTVVFVGYSFGGGADALSFEDFAGNLNAGAHVHVLCPWPDNADLCKQIGWALHRRPRGFRVFAQPFRWRAFAEAVLRLVDAGSNVSALLGLEAELLRAHDEN